MPFEYSHVLQTLCILAAQPVIKLLPDLLEVLYRHLSGMLMRVAMRCNGHEAPRLMTKFLIERIEQVGAPIARVLLGAAWTSPLLAGHTHEGNEAHTEI